MNPITLKPFRLTIKFKGYTYMGIAIPHLSSTVNNLPLEFSVLFTKGMRGKLIHTPEGWVSSEIKPARLVTIIGSKINSYYDLLLE